MASLKDITGQKFGRLSVESRTVNSGSRAAWNCVCECGNKTVVDGKKLRGGHTKSCGCLRRETASKVAEKKSITEEEFNDRISSLNLRLLTKFHGMQSPGVFQCLFCSKVWNKVDLYAKGCPNCSKSRNGFYSGEYFEKHPEKKQKSATLYFVHLSSDCESFYKIGITTYRTLERLRKLPYKIEIIKEYTGPLEELYEREKFLKKLNKNNRYKPQAVFNGKTECFSKVEGI